MRVDTVILGGGDGTVIDPESRFKGLVPIGGRPIIEWVVDAVRDATLSEGVAAVVPTAEDLGPWADKVDKIVVSDGTLMENVLTGTASFRVDRPVLVTTGDLPLLTGDALDDFIRSSLATGADFCYPLIRKEDILLQFPGTRRTYVKLKEGPVTGGNMMILNPALVERNRALGERLFRVRKSPVGMARVLGGRFVAKLLTGRLEIPELEDKMGELLGGTGAAIYTRHGSIGLDVDKPRDVDFVEGIMGGR